MLVYSTTVNMSGRGALWPKWLCSHDPGSPYSQCWWRSLTSSWPSKRRKRKRRRRRGKRGQSRLWSGWTRALCLCTWFSFIFTPLTSHLIYMSFSMIAIHSNLFSVLNSPRWPITFVLSTSNSDHSIVIQSRLFIAYTLTCSDLLLFCSSSYCCIYSIFSLQLILHLPIKFILTTAISSVLWPIIILFRKVILLSVLIRL